MPISLCLWRLRGPHTRWDLINVCVCEKHPASAHWLEVCRTSAWGNSGDVVLYSKVNDEHHLLDWCENNTSAVEEDCDVMCTTTRDNICPLEKKSIFIFVLLPKLKKKKKSSVRILMFLKCGDWTHIKIFLNLCCSRPLFMENLHLASAWFK